VAHREYVNPEGTALLDARCELRMADDCDVELREGSSPVVPSRPGEAPWIACLACEREIRRAREEAATK
jgi:hypothetical protein